MKALACCVLLVCVLAPVALVAKDQPQELSKLSLEELMRVEVTLVTRRPEPVGTSAAAISVIGRDDIRQAGVTTLADAIALADGVHVARFNNGTWAVSARGFNSNTSNKLLVMIDGRDEVTPLFTGVFWNTIDYVLDDIERIEVIRGPGATLWGANAVNGVVNVITRHARDTPGTLVTVGSGTEDPGLVEGRFGGGSATASYRVYGKFLQRDEQRLADGLDAGDGRRHVQTGFRADWERAGGEWLLKGDLFHGRNDFIDRADGEFTTAAVQAGYTRPFGSSAELQIRTYYRREYRNVPQQLTHSVDTVDLDIQHGMRVGARHNMIFGGGYRLNHDETFAGPVFSFEPEDRSYPLVSAFVQDEFAWRPDIFFTAGLKLEHNAFSGADWQPNARARWMLPRGDTLWGAVARAVRRPTRFEDDLVFRSPQGIVLIKGSDDFRSEVMTGWEVGYRTVLHAAVSLDATVFDQHYDDIRSQEAPPAGLVPITVGNTLGGVSRGLELSLRVQPRPRWSTQISYTRLHTRIDRDPDSRDVGGASSEANDAEHLFTLRTGVEIAPRVRADAWLRSVAALPNPHVPAFTELNLRLGWRPRANLELAFVGQDLLHDQHPEFGLESGRIEFQRSLRAVATIRLP